MTICLLMFCLVLLCLLIALSTILAVLNILLSMLLSSVLLQLLSTLSMCLVLLFAVFIAAAVAEKSLQNVAAREATLIVMVELYKKLCSVSAARDVGFGAMLLLSRALVIEVHCLR